MPTPLPPGALTPRDAEMMKPRPPAEIVFVPCEAVGCTRRINAKFDFCFTCFRRLPASLQDGCIKHKARAKYRRGAVLDQELRWHKDAVDEAREYLRLRDAEAVCEGRR